VSQEPVVVDPWYPKDYWVPQAEMGLRPFRYGDLFNAPSVDFDGAPLLVSPPPLPGETEAKPEPWLGALVLSPSCEIGAKSGDGKPILVARVKNASMLEPELLPKLQLGWKNDGQYQTVAYAKLAYLGPVTFSTKHNVHSFIDYTQTAWVNFEDLREAGRVAALDHEARACLIRREINYKYRWILPLDTIKSFETERIRNDANYVGVKPGWMQTPDENSVDNESSKIE